ncbi:MAG: HupE/UreJ family protein [Candidatus Eisenbacteria bacterium]|nr:HupE/UreJ family protein [Candidatus Eisenbacteria bacterium]
MNLFAILGLGLLLGLRHAADADHVVAVTTIAARERRVLPALWLGVVWGAGHTLTLFAVGAGIILFNWVVPPRLGLALEFCVALALITVGLLNLGRRRRADPGLGDAASRPPARRAFVVGLVHGLAGSAAVALLVLATVRDPLWACGYLLVFGAGTLLGMSLITTGFALPVATVARRWGGAARLIHVATGVLSLAFGLWMAWQIGFGDGLFLATPKWTAH